MNILLTHSYFLRFDLKQFKQKKPYPPLATIQAAANLRENGFKVNLFDTNFAFSPNEISPIIEKVQPTLIVIYDDGFNYLTKMCLSSMKEAAFELISISKKQNIPVFISSSDSTDHYEQYLQKGADVVILGEADETLLELCQALEKGISFTEISGIAFQKNGQTIRTSPRKILTKLDELPLPAWDLVDISPYQKAWAKHGYFSINIATTRGCPYKCNWCAKPIYGNRYNNRSPNHVVKEIKLIQSLFHFDHIWFCDDIFGLKPNWVQEFNAILKSENICINYKIQSRADLLLKDDTIQALATSGCDEVWIGAESGSQSVLDAMDKGTTVAQITESTRLMKKHGINPCFFLQFGYLGENWADIQATFSLLFKNMPHDIGVSVSYPLPGTKFYEKVKTDLGQKTNWTDSDELLMMYQGTYQPKFYKLLHRYVHKKFRAKQKIAFIRKGKGTEFFNWLYFFLSAEVFFWLMQLNRRPLADLDKLNSNKQQRNNLYGETS